MHEQTKDLYRLLDIQENARFVLDHKPTSKEGFLADRILQLAMVKSLENIGEAASKVSAQTKAEFQELDWTSMIKARHVYVHDYFKIDWARVWDSLDTVNFEAIIDSPKEYCKH